MLATWVKTIYSGFTVHKNEEGIKKLRRKNNKIYCGGGDKKIEEGNVV